MKRITIKTNNSKTLTNTNCLMRNQTEMDGFYISKHIKTLLGSVT